MHKLLLFTLCYAVLWIRNDYSGSGMIILDPDPALNFQSSGSRQKLRIQFMLFTVSIFGNCKQNHLKFNRKEESIKNLPFSISYNSPTVSVVEPFRFGPAPTPAS